MANVKISELNPLLTVQDADVLPIVDNGVTKKVTAAILQSYTQGNSVLLTGAQTVAGIKTFTSQLASSVATGTAPFSVASTTKVTNLNADLLDGLSSAAFQGALTLTTTGSSGASTLNTNTLNIPNYTLAGLGGVPYTGATQDVNLGTHTLLSGKTLIGSSANFTRFPNALGVISNTPSGIQHNESIYIGLMVEGVSVGDTWGSGLYGAGYTNATGAGRGTGVTGEGHVGAATDTGVAVGVRGYANDVHSGNYNIGLYGDAQNGTFATYGGNVALYLANGNIVTSSAAAKTWYLGGNLTFDGQGSSKVIGVTNGASFALGTITSGVWNATAIADAYIASSATWNAKQNAITLTTTGTSGAATLVGSTLNIPNYADNGITSLNGLTALTQTFAVGTSGTDFGISSSTSTHTFNLPTASATNRGALSSTDWTTFNNKQNALTNPITGTGTTNYLPKFTGASALGNSLVYDNGTNVGIGTTSPSQKLQVTFATNKSFAVGMTPYYQPSDYSILGGSIGVSRSSDGRLDLNTFYAYESNTGAENLAITGREDIVFYGNAKEYARFTSAGDIGIGTSSPYNKLQVSASDTSNIIGSSAASINITNSNADAFGRTSDLIFSVADGSSSLRLAAISSLYTNYSSSIGGALVFSTNNGFSSFAERMRITSGGNVLIGTTTDAGYKLDVNGTARVSGAATFSSSVTTGADATINGVKVGRGSGNISSNTTIGNGALSANTSGGANSAIGLFSLASNTTGTYNSAIGESSLYTNTTGSANTAIGSNALYYNNGSNNTAIGRNCLINNTASNNTAVGFEAALTNTSGVEITAIGYRALKANTGASNTAIGFNSLTLNTTGVNNTAVGDVSLSLNTVASNNSALGYNTQTGNFSGSVILGKDAIATAANQFVVGSTGTNAGTVATEVNASSKVWNVIINGVAQKILLA